MPLFPSDFKKFKHVSNDKKTVTLQHPAGHKIIIAKDAIKGDLRKQLDALCKGGKVKENEPAKMADGGSVLEEDSNSPDIVNKLSKVDIPDGPAPSELTRAQEIYNNLSQTPFESGQTDFRSMPSGKEPITPGGSPKSFDPLVAQQAQQIATQEQADNSAQMAGQQQKVIQENMARASMGLPAMPVPNTPAGPQPPGSMDPHAQGIQPADLSAASSMPKASPDGMAGGMQSMESMLQHGYQNQMAGIQQQATAQGDLGKQQAEVLAQAQKAETDAKAAYQQHYDELNQERQHLVKDVQDGQVDPEKFWNNHSKMASAIGMIIAGFNPTNSPNAAIEFLNKQMDRNIDAQKANLATKRSLLTANMEQFHNLKDATEMTRIQQADLVTNQLQQAAAHATSPLAKAAALQAAGQIQEKYAPMFQQFAMRRAMMNMAEGGGNLSATEHMIAMISQIDPEKGKLYREAYVPGVGISSTLQSIPETVRQQIIAHKSVNDLMNISLEFSRKHAGTLSPSERAEASTIQQQLIGSVKQAQHDGVYKPSEAEFLTNQIGGSPASFLANISSVPKLRAMQDIKQHEYSNLLKTFGIKGQPLPQADRGSGSSMEGKTATGPNGQKLINKAGKWVPFSG